MASVELRNIQKSYGAMTAIKNVSVHIEDGEFVALVGPSGCGKSTLLRMIAGLEEISGGEVLIDEKVVNDVQPKQRDIAMVFQSYALYPNLSVAENLGFALRLRKAPKAEQEEKVGRAAEILGLTEMLDRYPRQLSGGQRQRVAMGRAIVRDPKVFLFDEPLSNLDAKLRVQMRAEIRDLHRRLSTTMIYVTHDQIEAMTMAGRIVVLRGGEVEQVGAPLELYDDPANLFVATFIGSPAMNQIQARIAEQGVVTLRDGTVVDGVRGPAMLEAGTNLVLGLRPEHLEFAESGFPVKVLAVEPTGHETYVVTELAGQEVGVLVRDRVALAPDDRTFLRAVTSRVMLFDPVTGTRYRGPT